jgi:hypothetical protein
MAEYHPARRSILTGLAAFALAAPETARPADRSMGSPNGAFLFVDMTKAAVAAGVDLVSSTGFSSIGKGQARYSRWSAPMAALPLWGQGVWWQETADGARFQLAEPNPTSDMFGTVGDGVRAFATYTATGTDVTANIQRLIDYCKLKGIRQARLSPGKHVVTEICLGYGETFASVDLVADGPAYASWGDPPLSGACLLATLSDRPCLSIQGQRQCTVRGITFAGVLTKWIHDHGLAANSPAVAVTLDDTDPACWNDPNLHVHQDARYAPYAAVAIDPRSGPRPAISYPDIDYARYTRIATQYGKKSSSQITFEDCNFEGFTVGVAIQPCDADSNGDFVRFVRCFWSYAKYLVSAGNTQGRNVELLDCEGLYFHTMLEGLTHGRRGGRFRGPIINWSSSGGIQIVNGHGAYMAPLLFIQPYFEGVWRIGNLVGSASSELRFIGGDIVHVMTVLNNMRGTPANYFSGSARRETGSDLTSGTLVFDGTNRSVESVMPYFVSNLVDSGNVTTFDSHNLAKIPAYEAYCKTALAGGIAIPYFGQRPDTSKATISTTWQLRNALTGASAGPRSMQGNLWAHGARAFGSPAYARSLQGAFSPSAVTVPRTYGEVAKSSFSGLTLTGLVLTGIYSGTAGSSENAMIRPGDVLMDDRTGMTFFVSSFDTGTRLMTARLKNNYKGPPGREALRQPFSTSTGNFHTCSGRTYTPNHPIFVTSTAGSPKLTECGSIDGKASGYDRDIAVGDFFALDNQEDNMVTENGGAVAAMNAEALTITMTSNALKSYTDKRLTHMRVAPPANVVDS